MITALKILLAFVTLSNHGVSRKSTSKHCCSLSQSLLWLIQVTYLPCFTLSQTILGSCLLRFWFGLGGSACISQGVWVQKRDRGILTDYKFVVDRLIDAFNHDSVPVGYQQSPTSTPRPRPYALGPGPRIFVIQSTNVYRRLFVRPSYSGKQMLKWKGDNCWRETTNRIKDMFTCLA